MKIKVKMSKRFDMLINSKLKNGFAKVARPVEFQKSNRIIWSVVEEGNWKIRFPRSKSTGADSPVTVNVTLAPPEGNGL